MTADLEKLAEEIEGLLAKAMHAPRDLPISSLRTENDDGIPLLVYEPAHKYAWSIADEHFLRLAETLVNNAPAIVAALREVCALREALEEIDANTPTQGYVKTVEVRRAQYAATCTSCGKERTRIVTVEHTVNPFNKNDDGSVRTPNDVRRRAQAAAEQQAAKLSGSEIVCQSCARAAIAATLEVKS